MSVTLYHAPPSFYSQIARLVLAEKGVPYTGKLAAAGPPLFETYAPWYMRLNPGGTVPTLVHDGKGVPDSRAILHYVDETFDGPSLTPSDPDERAAMQRTIATLYEVSVRDITYGSGPAGKVGPKINAMRIKRLRKLAARNPDMREIYEAKLRDIEGFAASAQNPAVVEQQGQRMLALCDDLDRALAEREYVAGSSYSLADVVATIAVARMSMIGRAPLEHRPALAAWYERMRARPSFVGADVWERFRPSRLLGMVARKLGPYVLGVTVVVTLLVWALWYLAP
jgi:glutathione S-transferase